MREPACCRELAAEHAIARAKHDDRRDRELGRERTRDAAPKPCAARRRPASCQAPARRMRAAGSSGSGSTEARPRSEATWARQAGHSRQWATARAWRSPSGLEDAECVGAHQRGLLLAPTAGLDRVEQLSDLAGDSRPSRAGALHQLAHARLADAHALGRLRAREALQVAERGGFALAGGEARAQAPRRHGAGARGHRALRRGLCERRRISTGTNQFPPNRQPRHDRRRGARRSRDEKSRARAMPKGSRPARLPAPSRRDRAKPGRSRPPDRPGRARCPWRAAVRARSRAPSCAGRRSPCAAGARPDSGSGAKGSSDVKIANRADHPTRSIGYARARTQSADRLSTNLRVIRHPILRPSAAPRAPRSWAYRWRSPTTTRSSPGWTRWSPPMRAAG